MVTLKLPCPSRRKCAKMRNSALSIVALSLLFVLFIVFNDYNQIGMVVSMNEEYTLRKRRDRLDGYVKDAVYNVESGREIHIVVAVDKGSTDGLPVLINSTVENTKVPVRFHVFTEGDVRMPEAVLRCTGVIPSAAFIGSADQHINSVRRRAAVEFHHFDGSAIKTVFVPVRPELAKAGNYLRFHIHKLLPASIDDIIYLDSDTLVVRDLREFLAATVMAPGQVLSAVRMDLSLENSALRTDRVASILKERRNIDFDNSKRGFNAGVLRMNLKEWRAQQLDKEADYWIDTQNLQGGEYLWSHFGSQIVMQLVVYGRARILTDYVWNMYPGELRRETWYIEHDPRVISPTIGILHVTGWAKPWNRANWDLAVRYRLTSNWKWSMLIFNMYFNHHLPSPDAIRRCLPLSRKSPTEWRTYLN